MRHMVILSAAAFVSAAGLSAPASAQQQPQQPARKTIDPNEVICEKQQQLGSRIATKRVCMTRSEWAEQRRLNRQDVERVQTQRGVDTPQ